MAAASVRCYAAMLGAGKVYVDATERRLPLRHSHHRYAIDSPNGAIKLTIPLVGSTNAMVVAMEQVRISEHDQWRDRHWGALFSSYGKSPYFDYLADDLHRLIVERPTDNLLQFNLELHRLLVDFMDLPIETVVTHDPERVLREELAIDMRSVLGRKRRDNLSIADLTYYQVWQERFGFRPDLSAIDLACNLGREAVKLCLNMLNIKANA